MMNWNAEVDVLVIGGGGGGLVAAITAAQAGLDVAVELIHNHEYGIPVPDYVDENVSSKVVRIIQGYTGVVNRMVWRKY